ncbi:hypothetical protein LNTAR_12191 [Lentisphaera araneosa HTCC2155]|uniref:Uncharacterized protein n=1 Tax=Lentisphaera araneosa HTCC2155 TaxID=313628 RepID=A6DJN9_9BACT|nr:hypothetical protein LNTAR_12191 [Lentisphaera araneosa HTCC2155]
MILGNFMITFLGNKKRREIKSDLKKADTTD